MENKQMALLKIKKSYSVLEVWFWQEPVDNLPTFHKC